MRDEAYSPDNPERDWDGNGQEATCDSQAQSGIAPAGGAPSRRLQRPAESCQAPPSAKAQSQISLEDVPEWAGDGKELPAYPTQPCSLYRFFGAEGDLLYVGITSNGELRFYEHAKTKEWWPSVASSTVEHFPSREEARAHERLAIEWEQPACNIANRRPEPRMPSGIRHRFPTEDFADELEVIIGDLYSLMRDLDALEGLEAGDEYVAGIAHLEAALRAEREWLKTADKGPRW